MRMNSERPIRFSENYLRAKWLTNVDGYHVIHRSIVVNLGEEKACLSAPPEKCLHPRESTILKDICINKGDSLLVIEITEEENIGGIVLDSEWHQLGEVVDFPRDVPLWKSAQYEVGTVKFDPYFATGQSSQPQGGNLKEYKVKVNLWFSPAKTNCSIHDHHMMPEFLEVHTQIYGIGRMQKFHAKDFATLYQDVILGPGDTHIPFAGLDEKGGFVYPWHQYYSDTDCIWMANEFHPID